MTLKRSPMPPRRTPLRAKTRIARVTPMVRTAIQKRREDTCKQVPRIRWRKDTIPPEVRCQVDVRDSVDGVRHCVLCGLSDVTLHRHHRRLKGIGGDRRACTDCACNIITLCSGCHYWAHVIGRYDAEAEGFIVSGAEVSPGSISVLVHSTGDLSGSEAWPTCSGEWSDHAPGELVAA